jgi:hypothetical protein
MPPLYTTRVLVGFSSTPAVVMLASTRKLGAASSTEL